MRDIHQITSVVSAIDCATLTADNTPPAVDLAGFQTGEIVLCIGAGGITFTGVNKIEFVLTHSDDNSTYTAVVDKDVLGAPAITNGIIKALTTAHAAAAVYRFGYVGPKRYIKLLADFSGTHATGTPIAAAVVRARPGHAPTPDQG